MSRFIIPVLDEAGNKVYFETSPHKGQVTVDGYASVVMWLEKNNFKLATSVPEPTKQPVETTTSDGMKCMTCGSLMELKTGVSAKSGKPWKGYFCTGPEKGHEVKWIK